MIVLVLLLYLTSIVISCHCSLLCLSWTRVKQGKKVMWSLFYAATDSCYPLDSKGCWINWTINYSLLWHNWSRMPPIKPFKPKTWILSIPSLKPFWKKGSRYSRSIKLHLVCSIDLTCLLVGVDFTYRCCLQLYFEGLHSCRIRKVRWNKTIQDQGKSNHWFL